MKKILLINSSSRKRTTYKLLKSIEKILIGKGYKTEILNLHDYKINFCKGCEVCILKENGCTLKDDVEKIKTKIKESDGLVIGTPVYLNNMSGILKAFIDRTCSWFHRSEVAEKPTLLIANTQGSGLKNTLKSMEEVMIQWGVSLAGSISRTQRSFDIPIDEKEIKVFLNLLKEKNIKKPSLKEIQTYNIQRALATNLFTLDKAYWEKKGWITKPYFPGRKLSFIKKIYGNNFYKAMCTFIKN